MRYKHAGNEDHAWKVEIEFTDLGDMYLYLCGHNKHQELKMRKYSKFGEKRNVFYELGSMFTLNDTSVVLF